MSKGLKRGMDGGGASRVPVSGGPPSRHPRRGKGLDGLRARLSGYAPLPDALASIVTFVVALPLCIGIAVACGVPAECGLVTGIIGGLAVGLLSGAPLLVSGPAASLIVPVFDVVHNHGLVALAPIVVLSGVWQILAGVFRLGQWFRAVAPAVIHGMLIGIGILILASQLHVMLGGEPRATFAQNMLTFPVDLYRSFEDGSAEALGPLGAGVATIALLWAWNRYRPAGLALVPGHLVSLVTVTTVVQVFDVPIRALDISSRFFEGLEPMRLDSLVWLRDPSFIGLSLMFAFVASAATLLTASAIDQRQSYSRTRYNREMFAQGVGNMLAGAVGGLPMTGVIVRSSVNVDAGARTRVSTMLHGAWILLFVSIAPEVLERIPRATMGAILVYTGFKLIDLKALRALYEQSRGELIIALLTLFGVVFIELFVGILLGLGAAILKLVYTFSRLEIRSESGEGGFVHHLYLEGSATFVQLPRLAEALDDVPQGRELRLHIDGLAHIDHACLELLSNWERRQDDGDESSGKLIVEWDELAARYRRARLGGASESASLLRVMWGEWKRTFGRQGPEETDSLEALRSDWIDERRIVLRADAREMDDVLRLAAGVLAGPAGRSEAEVLEALRARDGEGHVTLGDGVCLPHAALADLRDPLAALVITEHTLQLTDAAADIFFVLLAPESDPRRHLVSLAHVGRLCQRADVLEGLRHASATSEVLGWLTDERVPSSEVDAVAAGVDGTERLLAVLEVEGHEHEIIDLIVEAFERPALAHPAGGTSADMLRRTLELPPEHRLLVLAIERRQVELLEQLLAEFARLVGPGLARMHVLRIDDMSPRGPAVRLAPRAGSGGRA